MKNQRQNKILELIERFEIGTQETLIEKLEECGFQTTQTTVSRDIRQLKLIKGPTGRGTYKYVSPSVKKENSAPAHNSALTDAVLNIETAQNIVVIKTSAGMANAIAVCVETLHIEEIIGAVAGDDTILLVAKTNENAEKIEIELNKIFNN